MLVQQLANLIKAEAVIDNEPSWRFLEKLGFHRTNILPDAHKKDGRHPQ